MRLKLEIDSETAERLVASAGAERRPVDWQAEVLLRRALGLPFPREGNRLGGAAESTHRREIAGAA